ncbi:hypothetical protein M8818_004381 [Zalaria obscura]|uniref:Uncharacterized protein n=1 Tax=Zalaria obscura TaxID=2024903 RepID=A0ACC3SBJ6_9PEZI
MCAVPGAGIRGTKRHVPGPAISSFLYKINHDYRQTVMMRSKMSFCSLLTLLLCPFVHASSAPGLTFLFNVSISLAKPLSSPTLVLPLGGIQLIEPLAKGTIVGPALNATISGGLAYPTATSNQSLQFPNVVIYGTANDNTTNFLVQETGVGTGNNQFTRLSLTIGGPYAYLQDEFVLGQIVANRVTETVEVTCWCVGCSVKDIATISKSTKMAK